MTNILRQILARVRCHWRLKLIVGSVLTIGICTGYFGLQRFHFGEARSFPLTFVDRWASFSPAWTIVYQSMYLMLPVAWLAETREQVWRYVAGLLPAISVAFAFFLFFPVTFPRPDTTIDGMLKLIHAYDLPLNAFPSLHMVLTAHAVAFGIWLLRPPVWAAVAAYVWVALIAYSTLATKQHYFVDVPAGVALGWAGQYFAGRWNWCSPRLSPLPLLAGER